MVSAADLDAYVDTAFGAALAQHGFAKVAAHRWVRSRNAPVRALFAINALKGGTYCPAWGISSGFAPPCRGRRISRQSTDKSAVMDLVMNPVDVSGDVPRAAYTFIAGYDTALPTRAVDKCAAHFIPLALADLDPVRTQADFCRVFDERGRLRYRRFQFHIKKRTSERSCSSRRVDDARRFGYFVWMGASPTGQRTERPSSRSGHTALKPVHAQQMVSRPTSPKRCLLPTSKTC